MDQVDAILRLKNCFKELEEIDKDQVYGNINAAKMKISKKIFEIAEVLDLSNFIPKPKADICEICNEPVSSHTVGTGTGKAHPDCFYKPKLKKIKPHKIHNHPGRERLSGLDLHHVIIDREVYDQLFEKWD